jgi:glycosyltransferase involved in cell wall biosynthesis
LFFKAGDADALASALREVAAEPDAAKARAEAARRRYEQYRWPISAQRYVELLDRYTQPARHGQRSRSDV